MISPLELFSHSVLEAPAIGCMLMCMTAAIIGVFQTLRGQALIGEVLSHACYPGVVVALLIDYLFFYEDHELISLLLVLGGAALSSLVALLFMKWHEGKARASQDVSMTLTLAGFFTFGLFLLSLLQNEFPTLERKMQSYLFGQAVLMRDIHVKVFAVLCLFVVGGVVLFFRPIQATLFDPTFVDLSSISRKKVSMLLFLMTLFSIVIGIRSLGVVLISSQLLFPAQAARMWTDRLHVLLWLSAIFGALSGFFGLYISHVLGQESAFLVPTGPVIVAVGASILGITILFSPKEGLFVRMKRRIQFFFRCQKENLLKAMCKEGGIDENRPFTMKRIHKITGAKKFYLLIHFYLLQRAGLIQKSTPDHFVLTPRGQQMGRKIIRLHRLWELYLVKFCHIAKSRVHPSAEEMEHILTPEIEQTLTALFDNPTKDPHNQPIPHA